jgi:acetylornithine deacetylase/succinyl-diaminopimelate desuccinylase-like protein
MRRVCLAAAVLALSCGIAVSGVQAAPPKAKPARIDTRAEAREMFERMIAFPTEPGRGAVPDMAAYLASRLKAAGFTDQDIVIERVDETATLVVRYRGRAAATKKPVIFMAHMDVVPASAEDWGRDPYSLTEAAGVLYGRGVVDNKYGALTIVQAFMRLKREGFVPDRDLILAFSGDEETTGKTATLLAQQLKGAAYAINSDAGGGFRPGGGAKPGYSLQVAEKTYATYQITARNSGGHSSAPRPDNAIYDLAAALTKLSAFKFPPRWNAVTLASFAQTAPTLDGDLAAAMKQFVASPGDPAALAVLEREGWVNNEMRTTCVATMLKGGHAENALPVAATATVNCRIFPGETVAEVGKTLAKVMDNDKLEFVVTGDPIESAVSEVPPEAAAALAKVIAVSAPGVVAMPYMEAGATDGLYFRAAGIPTIGAGPLFFVEGVDYNYHGNNERLPVAQFNEGLDPYYLFIKALAGK